MITSHTQANTNRESRDNRDSNSSNTSYATTTLPSRPYTSVNIREVTINDQQSNFV
jgi:hypothetical protein